MSASEKLKALEAEYRQQVLPDALATVLPRVVAVVKAAEAMLAARQKRARLLYDEEHAVEDALSALEEALS